VRSVITVHAQESVDVRGRSTALVHAATRRTYPLADTIIAVSEGIARDLEEHFGIDRERVRVVPNPIDVAHIRKRAKDAMAPGASELPKRPYLVHVGRHAEPKGLDSLLRIYAELRRQMPQAPQLVLVGTGPLTERLMQLADALGLAARSSDNATSSASPDAADVLFAGHRDNPFPWIANATALVLPSLWEGLGLAPLEALALGTPVLLSDCVGPREILAPATGQPRRLLEAEPTEYGLLLPTTHQLGSPRFRGETATNDPERVWADTLKRVLNEDEGLLSKYRAYGPKRASDFDVEKIGDLWWDAVLGD
jgi:glycosyltransferase involved in cell wall biosynthesis